MAGTKSVAEWCQEKGIDVEQLIEQSELDRQRVLAIMLGRWTPSPAEREKVSAALGVPKESITWGHKTPIQHIYGHGPG